MKELNNDNLDPGDCTWLEVTKAPSKAHKISRQSKNKGSEDLLNWEWVN